LFENSFNGTIPQQNEKNLCQGTELGVIATRCFSRDFLGKAWIVSTYIFYSWIFFFLRHTVRIMCYGCISEVLSTKVYLTVVL